MRRKEMREASESIDKLRESSKTQGWSGAREIRKWRDRDQRSEIVIDSSVAVKWFSSENATNEALAPRNENINGTRDMGKRPPVSRSSQRSRLQTRVRQKQTRHSRPGPFRLPSSTLDRLTQIY